MFVSFAQNFEDVLLWRALKHIDKGFYIDIGAQHPEEDSVSKAFYDHDWRGVHIEPIRQYADLIRDHRPDEVVLEVALAETSGILTFYDVPQTGLSTADSAIAETHRHQGFAVYEMTIPCITLADLLVRYGDRDIHWVKIDVEGFELQVLKGWGDSPARPWIVVVESTLPNTQTDTHELWETQLLERDYIPALFDGLNRYYVSKQHSELTEALQYGPTVFDQFAFSPTVTHAYTTLFRQELDQQRDRAQQALNQERDRAQQLETEWNTAKEQIAALELQMRQQEQAFQQKLVQEKEHIRELEKQKRATVGQIEVLQIQLAQREQAATRERDRAQTLQSKWDTAQEKNKNLNKRANQARKEANQLRQELASVYSSMSWKFGAPLRVSKRIVKRVLRVLQGPSTPTVLPASSSPSPQAEQLVKPTPAAATHAADSAASRQLTAELNQVSISTQQVYQRLMHARRSSHQDPD